MIYICCDMNCDNFGNFFKIIGHERKVKKDKNGFMIDSTHYPLGACYRGKPPHPFKETFRYSEAIDILHPEDFVVWQQRRFNINKYKINSAIQYAHHKLGLKWDDNRQRLSFYEYVNEYLCDKTT